MTTATYELTTAVRLAGFAVLVVLSLAVAGYAVAVYGFLPLGVAIHPDMRAAFEANRAAIYLHIFASAVALFLGPLQFWVRLRTARPALHRWSGRIAFLLVVPVAVHCLYALGFQHYSSRVLIHSLLGCAFFGAFTVKMLILPKRGLRPWVLPVVGALVFTLLVAVWLTSALWFFSTFGLKR